MMANPAVPRRAARSSTRRRCSRLSDIGYSRRLVRVTGGSPHRREPRLEVLGRDLLGARHVRGAVAAPAAVRLLEVTRALELLVDRQVVPAELQQDAVNL